MPRYKFSWDNLPPTLLRALRRDLAIEGDASAALRRTYGARPSPDFVRDAWATLLQSWLPRDKDARTQLVEQLRERRLGDTSIKVTTARGQLDYLGSCRNGTTLRGIAADLLIAAGEKPAATPSPAAQPAPTKARSKAWQQFVTSLAASLSALEEDQYLIIQHKDRPWFVQFAVQGAHGLRAEMISNSYLEGRDRLPKKAIDAALGLGWSPPTGDPESSTPETDPDGSPNYFRQWEQPVAYIDASRMAVETLVGVLSVPHPGFLQYAAFEKEGTKILLPTLGLQRQPADPDDEDGAAEGADVAMGANEIRHVLLMLFRQLSGNDELDVDEDGDIGLRYGSSSVFVRVFGDPPMVRVLCPVLSEITAPTDLPRLVNDLNAQYGFIRWLATPDAIMATIDLFGTPFVTQHVLHACGVVGETCNELDEQLQERLGGRTFFGEYRRPQTGHGLGGYL